MNKVYIYCGGGVTNLNYTVILILLQPEVRLYTVKIHKNKNMASFISFTIKIVATERLRMNNNTFATDKSAS